MSVTVRFDGLDAFREQLRKLPEHLAEKAGGIVEAAANDAARSTVDGYPEGPTGNLKAGVTSRVERSRFAVAAVVRSRAKHASIFEKGTQTRHTKTGANRGAMPQPPESERFIPKAIRHRQRMVKQLIDVVREAGFEVDA